MPNRGDSPRDGLALSSLTMVVRRGLALLLVPTFVAACDHDKPAAPAPAAASSFAAAPAPGGIVPGSRVLTPFGPTLFVEAEVVRVTGTRVTTKKGKTFDADVLVLLPPGGETSPLRPAQPVLARVSRGLWTVTTIEKVDGDRFVVATEKHHRLVRSDLLTPPKGVTRALRTRLGADALRRKAQSLVPYRPKGYAPKVGDPVLYRTRLDGGRWFSGKIAEAAGGAYRIRVANPPHRHLVWPGANRPAAEQQVAGTQRGGLRAAGARNAQLDLRQGRAQRWSVRIRSHRGRRRGARAQRRRAAVIAARQGMASRIQAQDCEDAASLGAIRRFPARDRRDGPRAGRQRVPRNQEPGQAPARRQVRAGAPLWTPDWVHHGVGPSGGAASATFRVEGRRPGPSQGGERRGARSVYESRGRRRRAACALRVRSDGLVRHPRRRAPGGSS